MIAVFSLENLEGKRQLGNTSIDGRIILKWILNKWGGRL
jgi:hypothetical protein